MPAEFVITEKTPNSWLKTHNLTGSEALGRIASDIDQNTRELLAGSGMDWDAALPMVRYKRGGISDAYASTGIKAVETLVGSTFGSMAVKLNFDMNSPTMVYLSGDFFARYFKRIGDKQATRLAQIESRQIRIAEGDIAKAVNIATELMESSRSWERSLREILFEYAAQTVLDEDYLATLGDVRDCQGASLRQRQLLLIINGRIDEVNTRLRTPKR